MPLNVPPPDDRPPAYAAPFACALIAYTTVGMGTLLWISETTPPQNGLRPTPVVMGVIALAAAFALFARFGLRWRGFLAGALLASALVVAVSVALVWLLEWHAPHAG